MKHKFIKTITILTIFFTFAVISINPIISTSINKKNGIASTNYGELFVYYIDVGQGDCILIQTPDNFHMLIDAGSNDDTDSIITFLGNHNIYYNDTIDVFVATHPHADHIGGVPGIFDAFDIGSVYHPGYNISTTTYQEEFLPAIKNEGCPIYTDDDVDPGDFIDFSFFITCQILNIDKDAKDANAASIVLRMDYDHVSFLFTGDIDEEVEDDLVYDWDVNIDILKVAHHGSRYSSSDDFLNASSPDVSIICVGEDNSYGHPHNDVLQRLEEQQSKIYRTDINGDITVKTDGTEYTVYYEKSVNHPSTPIIKDEPDEHTYSAYSTDPEDDKLYYTWDWDDGGDDLILGPFSSGEKCYNNHTWDEEGTYYIKVKATDEYGYESEWGILKVKMPRKKLLINNFLKKLLEKFHNLSPFLDKFSNLKYV